MTPRISALISASGVLAALVLLVVGIHEYSETSALWLGAEAILFLGALCTLVRDVRRLRTGRRPEQAV
ncbi:hypothetical protein AB0L71_14635 [Streptomyces sp. NPDC052052]|uniref:hypothetical protein n=1 Tax=Streptomyces sp. NPDC052052 TaxID=3154756 RepID=UPI00344AC035